MRAIYFGIALVLSLWSYSVSAAPTTVVAVEAIPPLTAEDRAVARDLDGSHALAVFGFLVGGFAGGYYGYEIGRVGLKDGTAILYWITLENGDGHYTYRVYKVGDLYVPELTN